MWNLRSGGPSGSRIRSRRKISEVALHWLSDTWPSWNLRSGAPSGWQECIRRWISEAALPLANKNVVVVETLKSHSTGTYVAVLESLKQHSPVFLRWFYQEKTVNGKLFAGNVSQPSLSSTCSTERMTYQNHFFAYLLG